MNLIPKGRQIFFNEELHKYTDEFDNPYISCTTIIGRYTPDKDFKKIAEACAKIGRNPRHPKYEKYKGKTMKQLLYEWEAKTKRACDKGSVKHDYLENAIKTANNYKTNAKGFVNDRIYTLDNIIAHHKYGRVTLQYFINIGLDTKYPAIFAILKHFTDKEFRIYAEIGVYDINALVSGLIDVFIVNDHGEFVILDWKTNEAPLMFEAGYFEKDNNGKITENFIRTNETFKYPLEHLDDSVGNHYGMQLSGYAYMAESFGFKCLGLILCHIRTIGEVDDYHDSSKDQIEIYDMTYMKENVALMFNNYASNNTINSQYRCL